MKIISNNMMIYMIIVFQLFSILLVFLGSLIGVAFFTLLERKILGYIQDRKGPNKVGMMGIFQPFSDAIKLFLKENIILFSSYLYMFSPMMGFIISVMACQGFKSYMMGGFKYSMLFLVGVMMMISYMIMLGSWASNSHYSLLGGVRSVVQGLSYEVCMFFCFFSFYLYLGGFKISMLVNFKFYPIILINFMLFLLFMICILADLGRVPFDLMEGESELVSGFNTEYMGVGFGLFFLAENMLLLILMEWLVVMFFNQVPGSMMFSFFSLFLCLMMIIIRGVFPRFRFDKLQYFCWFTVLPWSMMMVMLIGIYKYTLFI
uniref:NADH-ubiquinone oxidoreductase chain 1 n=1 Tax=Allorhynchium sp. GX TaxID=2742723 RepID=A0A6M9AWA9_9HYME|nr:NADH dehydrogenase subunit 1 [Allorhynchium sp. GX]QKK69206.1 NADH dehydrogenase subunit 1 [Allorhynchium sp. GX]